MNQYLLYIIGPILFAVPVGAFIAKYLITWIGGFKPRYTKTLLSTLIAYVITSAIVIALYRFGQLGDAVGGFQMLTCWAALTCTHINIVKSDTGVPLKLGKAMLVALCQMIGVFIVLMLLLIIILVPLVLIKRAWLGQH